jgi:hypothetical protein
VWGLGTRIVVLAAGCGALFPTASDEACYTLSVETLVLEALHE